MYTNDLPDLIKNYEINLYADDIKLYFRFSPNKWRDVLQQNLCVIENWAAAWQLSIAIDTNFLLHLGSKNINHPYKLNNMLMS